MLPRWKIISDYVMEISMTLNYVTYYVILTIAYIIPRTKQTFLMETYDWNLKKKWLYKYYIFIKFK